MPIVHNIMAYICLALNVVLPGIGTILAACLSESHAANKTQITVGVFQFLTAIYLFGWIWSIYWGALIVEASQGGHREIKRLFQGPNAEIEGNQSAEP